MKVLVSLLVAVGCLLAVPVSASAVTYTVDSIGDQPDETVGSGGCKTSLDTCTLRAAIQESNNTPLEKDKIAFKSPDFNGQLVDTIEIGASFPVITDPVTIDGDGAGQCMTEALVSGPCVGVAKTGGGFGLVVEDDEVMIEGLAVTGALTGINVINASVGFIARGNWVGVKLDGTAGANNTGIFIDPNSDGAKIGGFVSASERNVIANNNNEGLDIEGASDAAVLGNYFGVAPDGSTAAPNPIDIEVSDSTAGAFDATGNKIGGDLLAIPATTPCDRACNVISGATIGVDLEGTGPNEAPASGPTTIQGNYIGLNAAGTGAVPNSSTGVAIGGADEVTVGGPLAADANYINGGTFGVQAGGLGPDAEDLLVQGNLIGLNVGGTATLSAPTGFGIFSDAEGMTDETLAATISGNRISMIVGEAILQHGSGATITGNTIGRGSGGESIGGGTVGFRAYGNQSFGSTLEGNVIQNAEGNAVLIENNNNLAIGNTIAGAGAAGIRIQSFGGVLEANGNTIGGEIESEENSISKSGGDAIEIAGPESTDNQIERNSGSGNVGLFIDLGANGPGNPTAINGGILPPSIDSAKLTGASGSGALPNAEIRVFRKATTAAGELQSFLGKVTADGIGNWSLAYGTAIPGDTLIAATQTGPEGTSELAFAKTEPAPKTDKKDGAKPDGKPPTEACLRKAGSCQPAPVPQTKILKGPKRTIHATTVKFTFFSSEEGSKFECKLDRKKFKPCKSPKTYKKLKPGKHVFKVRAIKGKSVDPTPAKRKFKVLA